MVINTAEVRVEEKPCVVGLPTDAYVEYFGLLPIGNPFVICRPRDDWNYKDFVLIVGGQSIRIKKVTRYRDGGTTDVETVIGNFHFPTPFDEKAKATFDGKEIVVYDETTYSKALL